MSSYVGREAPVARAPAKRLFFALWPDDAQRNALANATLEVVGASGGRPVPSRSLHITLSFLGSVPEARIPDLGSIARRIAAALPADAAPLLKFERVEYWKKPQILCALGEGDTS